MPKGKWPKRIPIHLPRLPNIGSPGQTPASLAIDAHYLNLDLIRLWNWEHFVRLCHFLKMTDCEVASLVLLPHKDLAAYRERNLLPLKYPHALSVALTLTLLETYLMRGLTEDLILNPFPDLNKVSP